MDFFSALFESYVPLNSKVLDIGAGGGYIAKNISKSRNAKVTLLDIIDFNHTDLPLILYDGKDIPFSGNNFDISLLISVLHHCENPKRVLSETARVTKLRLIVFEELYENFWQRKFQCLADILFNFFYIFKPAKERENMPFNFKKKSEWENIFKSLGLQIIYQKNFKLLGILPRVIFVLEKSI